MVCEGEARPNQRAPASVYQQMRPKLVAMGKEQRAANTCGGSNVRNTVLDLRDLPTAGIVKSRLFSIDIDMTTMIERSCTPARAVES
jgi:hypothetical protein